jgi:hypothetical protein
MEGFCKKMLNRSIQKNERLNCISISAMKVNFFLAIGIFSCGAVQAQQLIFPDSAGWNTLYEGKVLKFRVSTTDATKPHRFSLEGINDTGIQFDSLGNFFWNPSYDLVDRLTPQKEFAVIFQAEWSSGRRVRAPVTFTVFHKNRPPVVDELPIFYVKQSTVNHYQISTDYVKDPDGDPVVFKAIPSQMPEGASLSSSGMLTWKPSRSQFTALKNNPLTISFFAEDQPYKSETQGKIRIMQTQLDLPPEILLVPGDSVITIKEDELLNLKLFVSDPNGDDEIKDIDFISSDGRISKNNLRRNTNAQAEFTWTPGYAFTDDAEKSKEVTIIFFALDKANNRVQRKVKITVLDAENLEEKDKLLYQKYRSALVSAKALIDRLDVKQEGLKKEFKQAKKGKRNRAIGNASLGACTGLSPIALPTQESKVVSGVGGTLVATLGTLEATEVIGKSKNDILDKQKASAEIRNQLQVDGDNFARKYSLKSNRRLKEFDTERDKLSLIANDPKLMTLELDASKPAYPKYDTKELKKTFPDFSEQ